MSTPALPTAYASYMRELARVQPEDFPTQRDFDHEVAQDIYNALVALNVRSIPTHEDDLEPGEKLLLGMLGGVDYCRALLQWQSDKKRAIELNRHRKTGNEAPVPYPPTLPESDHEEVSA